MKKIYIQPSTITVNIELQLMAPVASQNINIPDGGGNTDVINENAETPGLGRRFGLWDDED